LKTTKTKKKQKTPTGAIEYSMKRRTSMEKIKTEITVTQITPDLIVSLKKQRYLRINGVRQNIGQPERVTVIPLLWEALDNFVKTSEHEECVCEVGNDVIFRESGPCLTHPLVLMLKNLWTEEIRDKFRKAYNLGNEMHLNLREGAKGEQAEHGQAQNENEYAYDNQPSLSPQNNEQVVKMQIKVLQNEINSINTMMQSFAAGGFSEEEFLQLQQAQTEILKQIRTLQGSN